jgi:hypothetical protein
MRTFTTHDAREGLDVSWSAMTPPSRAAWPVAVVVTGALALTVTRPRRLPGRVQQAADRSSLALAALHPPELYLLNRSLRRAGVPAATRHRAVATTALFGVLGWRSSVSAIRAAGGQGPGRDATGRPGSIRRHPHVTATVAATCPRNGSST